MEMPTMTSTAAVVETIAPGSVNPADGTPLPPVPETSPEGVVAAVAAARAAQAAWANTSLDTRAAAALRFGQRLIERRAELARVLSQETGRSETECLMSELATSVSYAKAAVRAAR